MAHQPVRPFESLEWYREAARNNFRDDDPRGGLAGWASGFGMLHAHIGLFAAGIVAMLLINLIRTPESIWAGRWIMAWTVLVLIHAVAIGILWALRQWNGDAPDEALLVPPGRQREIPPVFTWGSNGVQGGEAQDVDFRAATRSPPAGEVSRTVIRGNEAGWSGWNADGVEEDSPETGRVSWKEASAAAWLERTPPDTDEHEGEPESKPKA